MVVQGQQQACCQPTTANSSMLSLTSMQNFLILTVTKTLWVLTATVIQMMIRNLFLPDMAPRWVRELFCYRSLFPLQRQLCRFSWVTATQVSWWRSRLLFQRWRWLTALGVGCWSRRRLLWSWLWHGLPLDRWLCRCTWPWVMDVGRRNSTCLQTSGILHQKNSFSSRIFSQFSVTKD